MAPSTDPLGILWADEGEEMDAKLKHLEFIQATIVRQSTNSFLVKGWSVVLVSALFALAAPGSQAVFVYLAYAPAIIFWGLDGYFLWQERLYRALYDHVRIKQPDDIDFSMDTSAFRDQSGCSWAEASLSRTLLAFHGVLVLTIFTVMMLALRRGG